MAIYVGNAGTEPLRLLTYTSNVNTRVNGGLQMEQEGVELREPATWMNFPTEELSIEPGLEVRRDFTVTVPEGTSPGEYVMPIAAETVDAFAVPNAPALQQKIRKIIAVYIVVPGETVASFELGVPEVAYVSNFMAIQVPAVNTGDVTLRLSGKMTISDHSGGILVEDTIRMGVFYRGHETFVRTTLVGGGLPPGEYLVSLELKDDMNGASAAIENLPVTVTEEAVNEQAPLEFQNVLILPNAEPIQFASVAVDIVNAREPVRSARLIMVVEKDGTPVEDFIVADNMTLQQGVTTVTQRYLPLSGWESGTYSFSLRLETTGSDGSVQVLLTSEDVATIEVP